MGAIIDSIAEFIKGILADGIISNKSGLFDSVNEKVGEIAENVGATLQGWNSSIYNMVHYLSESVVLPIAGLALAFVATPELIGLITAKKTICTTLRKFR